MLNLSSIDLSADETRVLAQGFIFSPTLRELPIRDIIIGVEALVKTGKITQEIATDPRNTTITEIDRMQRREKQSHQNRTYLNERGQLSKSSQQKRIEELSTGIRETYQ